MAWQDTLIRLYLYICHHYDAHLYAFAERFSNNQNQPAFTDPELITSFLFGLIQKHKTLSAIHEYTRAHLGDWFPTVPMPTVGVMAGMSSA